MSSNDYVIRAHYTGADAYDYGTMTSGAYATLEDAQAAIDVMLAHTNPAAYYTIEQRYTA